MRQHIPQSADQFIPPPAGGNVPKRPRGGGLRGCLPIALPFIGVLCFLLILPLFRHKTDEEQKSDAEKVVQQNIQQGKPVTLSNDGSKVVYAVKSATTGKVEVTTYNDPIAKMGRDLDIERNKRHLFKVDENAAATTHGTICFEVSVWKDGPDGLPMQIVAPKREYVVLDGPEAADKAIQSLARMDDYKRQHQRTGVNAILEGYYLDPGNATHDEIIDGKSIGEQTYPIPLVRGKAPIERLRVIDKALIKNLTPATENGAAIPFNQARDQTIAQLKLPQP